MTTTYGGGESSKEDMSSGEETVVGNTTTEMKAEPSAESATFKKEAEEAENEGKEVEVGNDNETIVIEEPATTEEKEEINNGNGSTDANWEDLLNSSNVTVQEDKNDIAVEEEKNDATVEEDKNDTAVEEDKNDATVEEDNKVEKLTVTALDGNETIVNSTVQYKVTGENVVFNGLEGYNYSFSNGILSIETGSEATILTVEAVDATGAILFDININGIVG